MNKQPDPEQTSEEKHTLLYKTMKEKMLLSKFVQLKLICILLIISAVINFFVIFDMMGLGKIPTLLIIFFYCLVVLSIVTAFGLWYIRKWSWYLVVFLSFGLAISNSYLLVFYFQLNQLFDRGLTVFMVGYFLYYFNNNEIRQKFLKPKYERIPEPSMVMDEEEQDKEYATAGEEAGITITYELIVTKLLRVAPTNGKALDICTGSGVLLCRIAREMPGIDFTAIDLSSHMLSQAEKNKLRYSVGNIHTKQLNMFDIDKFPKRSFDMITWNFSMHHCDDHEQVKAVINKALPLLKEDGLLFIWDIERLKSYDIAVWFTNKYSGKYGPYYYHDSLNSYLAAFSYEEFDKILKESEWENYEHVHAVFGNFFQYACTRKENRVVSRMPNLKHVSQVRDYYILKLGFFGHI